MSNGYFRNNKLVFEGLGAREIMYRNFQGKPGKFNKEGDRNFSVRIDDEKFARQLKDDGWTVTIREATEEYDKPLCYIKVKVSYANIPPVIHLVTSTKNVVLDEEAISMLDWAEIVNVDLVINPYEYSTPARSGIAAYLRSMYVTIEDDPFEEKYANRQTDDIPF